MSVGLLERAITLNVWLSLAAPEPIPPSGTVCSAASSLRVRLLIGLRVGGSFTGNTVSRKEVLALLIPSLTVTVIVALPFSLVAGAICKLRERPLPPKTIFPVGISTGLEEVAERTRLAGLLSTSASVSGNESTASSLMVWLAMVEIMGASFTALTVNLKLVLALAPCGSRTVSVITVLPD